VLALPYPICNLWPALTLALALVAGAAAADQPAAARPNVVLIVIDDFGWADLGCYGSKFYRTPHVDRLAAEGMRFTQAYAACPVCSPTRAALMTGKYPARLHLTDWLPGRGDMPSHKLLRPAFRQELPLDEITLAEVLHGAGYATAAIGKWHLGGEGFEPTRQGFDVGIGGAARGSVPSHFAPYLPNGASLPGLASAPDGEYLADRLTAEAEKFIEAHSKRPFFLYLPHYSVHTPIMAKPELVAKYDFAAKPPGLQNNPRYAAMIESMDDSVGRITRKIESLGLTHNTILVFTSDNGGLATAEGPHTPATNNAPLREGKGYLYEGGIRVPLVVRWPAAVKAGTMCAVPVSSIDVLPTIADVCHLAPPEGIDGVSLVPLLKQSGSLHREALYWHYPHYAPQGGKPGGAIREGDFKLIEFYEQGRRELYNVVHDVSENNNLAEADSQRAEQMAAKLAAWRKAVDAQMPLPNPDFEPPAQADDRSVTLVARTADVHGVMVRFEPLPHKNTIGFWVRADDWVSWDFQIATPGEFEVEILQGCGPGSGGSQVDFSVGEQTLSVTVEETGGFQKFVARRIGKLKLPAAGRYTLSVKPRTKPGAAVMDLREVRLLPVTAGK
jgi:arylsulfatase A